MSEIQRDMLAKAYEGKLAVFFPNQLLSAGPKIQYVFDDILNHGICRRHESESSP